MTKDEQERTATREKIGKIFNIVDTMKDNFHSLDKNVGIMQVDLKNMKTDMTVDGCPVLIKETKNLREEIVEVKTFVKTAKYLLGLIFSAGGVSELIAYFKKWRKDNKMGVIKGKGGIFDKRGWPPY